ncbi:MAG: IPT/TIG domain-containing protein [Candidatus Acidiferrales bacterium]
MKARFIWPIAVASVFLAVSVLASCGGNSGAPAVTLQSIVVTSPGPSVAVGSMIQFTAIGHFSDGSTSDITGSVMWASSNTNAATISATGLAKGVAVAQGITITAMKSGVTGSSLLNVVAAPAPSITSLTPNSGVVGASVVIAGANFGATQGASTVKFNGVAATATVWSATSITTPVPAGATTGNVVVTVGGITSNGKAFTVTLPPPTITSLNPATGVVGSSVVIAGANFGGTQGASTVKFNGVATTPTVWSATSITASVPVGATTGNVVVTVGGVASNGVSFTVTTSSITVTISPKRAGVTLSQPQQFTGAANNDPLNGGVSWSVDGVNGGGAASGTVSASGLYTPGTQPGVHTVTATSKSNTSVNASATVAVTDLAGVFTYHNDSARTGQNLQEYALTTSTVNSSTFGALFTCGNLDGYLYAAPLYYANLNVAGQTRNVVFVATEHDSVYAYDADSPACVQLWKTSFISPPNVVPVAPADVDELSDLTPEIGITSTPVIDPTTKTIYVMAKTKEFVGTVSGVACTSGAPCFVHRLHALDVTTGAEKFGGPVVVTAPNFISLTHLQRPGLLLNNGIVYVAIGSHGDNGIWQGWMMAYNATTLAQLWSYHTTDPINGNNGGAIWGSGNAPAIDASGNIYFETGNGFYDGGANFADSVIKLSPGGVKQDSFTPFDQQIMQNNDIDLGSSNPIILPDSVGSVAHPHLMIAMGKVGVIYLLDQTNMGGYNAAANQDVGEVTIMFNTSSSIKGFFGQPAYWNENLYEVVVGDSIRQLPISNGSIATSSTSHTTNTFSYRAGTPVVSASGTTNGIVWMLDDAGYQTSVPAVLYAYNATNLGTMLYSSPASGAGALPVPVKFPVPIVANGKVYVGGQKAFSVHGLLPN